MSTSRLHFRGSGLLWVGVAAAAWAAATVAVGARVQGTSRGPSVLDGVFTDAQVKRGQVVYTGTCVRCHGNALEGGESAPPLVGAGFIANWNGSSVGDLVDRTRRSMPDGDPGSLTRPEYTDVITFILSANRYPTGKVELPPDSVKQKTIKIEAIK